MPKFDGDYTMDISPTEFYDSCSSYEQNKLADIVAVEFDLLHRDEIIKESDEGSDDHPKCAGHINFNAALLDLRRSWLSITKADEEAILAIAKKYFTI